MQYYNVDLFLKSFTQGNKKLKAIKFIRLFKHTFFWIIGLKIGDYRSPSPEIIDIGYFDKRRRVHVKKEFRGHFKNENLYHGGEYKKMHPEPVSLCYYKGSVILKKWYYGVNKFNQFYNELICYNRLKNKCITPKIKFVDYKKCCIYMEYIHGTVLSNYRRNGRVDNNPSDFKKIKYNFSQKLEIMHDKGVLLRDMRDDNMIHNEREYFIDFADSVYSSAILNIFLDEHKKHEFKKMMKEINNCEKVFTNQSE